MKTLRLLCGLLASISVASAATAAFEYRRPIKGVSVAPTVLYPFTAHTFTPCGAMGANGPTLAQCKTAYSGVAWAADTTAFNVSSGIQQWTVPETGTYEITAQGASGGWASNYAAGAAYPTVGEGLTVQLALSRGSVLKLLVGQAGQSSPRGNVGGGGGASFVVEGMTPLVIGAGGTGAPYASSHLHSATSGAGFSTEGIADHSIPAKSFLNGGLGGRWDGGPVPCTNADSAATGGFGGGGAGTDCHQYGGGGGGYKGGTNGSAYSYSSSAPISTAYGSYGAQGFITIRKL